MDLTQIIQLASDQYHVENATISIESVKEISDVFAPPHHGPQNVPIEATLSSAGQRDAVDQGLRYPNFTCKLSCIRYLGQHS